MYLFLYFCTKAINIVMYSCKGKINDIVSKGERLSYKYPVLCPYRAWVFCFFVP